MFRRQFVNLIARNRTNHPYSLRRIDAAKHLFYPSTKEAEAATADEKKYSKTLRRLADPIVSFDPSPTGVLFPGLEWFELFAPGRGEGRIVNSNKAGETAMFDADKFLLLTLPSLSQAKGPNPVTFSITHPGDEEDSLYIMNRSYTTIKDAADGCTAIYMSLTDDKGTYCFDTACLDSAHRLGWRHLEEWRRVGAWVLPFDGRAKHVPELGIWLGFTAGRKPHHLCAVDLSSMDPCRAPTLEHATLPGEKSWDPRLLKLVNMGGNRFCIAKLFDHKDKQFLVLTGVELEPPQDGSSLRMVQHKRVRYVFKGQDLNWVL
ncbi:unnamed protein product [Alopecurus aequalis]